MQKHIGIDIDGVLADFNSSMIERTIKVTGRDLFPPRPFDIPCWDYPEKYGYTNTEMSAIWGSIKIDPEFWQNLSPYPTAYAAGEYLRKLQDAGHDLYFITSRPGVDAKAQTEEWLAFHLGMYFATVLISSEKALCARALDLDAYIDDKWENAFEVATTSRARTYLLDRPWNRFGDAKAANIIRTDRVVGMAEGI